MEAGQYVQDRVPYKMCFAPMTSLTVLFQELIKDGLTGHRADQLPDDAVPLGKADPQCECAGFASICLIGGVLRRESEHTEGADSELPQASHGALHIARHDADLNLLAQEWAQALVGVLSGAGHDRLIEDNVEVDPFNGGETQMLLILQQGLMIDSLTLRPDMHGCCRLAQPTLLSSGPSIMHFGGILYCDDHNPHKSAVLEAYE